MFPILTHGLALNIAFVFLGAGMGVAIERGGMSDARKLAAQFYFYDMRVYKVMFTAILVAASLLLAASSVGLVNLNLMYVDPSYLGPGILGGLVFGVGFIIGGYCPGTSLVAIATGKLDALVFGVGMIAGTAVFAETVPLFWDAYNNWGALGRVTLPDVFGISAGVIMFVIVVVAIATFVLVERVETWLGLIERPSRSWRIAQLGGAIALVLVALFAMVLGQPSVDDMVRRNDTELSALLQDRAVQVSPYEVLDLMTERKVGLRVLDVRSDVEYNLFHILDAEPLPALADQAAWIRALPEGTVVLLYGNDEASAETAWKRLTVQADVNGQAPLNAYILAGGLNAWIDTFIDHSGLVAERIVKPLDAADVPPDGLRYQFAHVLGASTELARPEIHEGELPEYEPVIKIKAGGGGEGGCG